MSILNCLKRWTSKNLTSRQNAHHLLIPPGIIKYQQIFSIVKDLQENDIIWGTMGCTQGLLYHFCSPFGCCFPRMEDGSLWDQSGHFSGTINPLAGCCQYCSGSHEDGNGHRWGFKVFAVTTTTNSSCCLTSEHSKHFHNAHYVFPSSYSFLVECSIYPYLLWKFPFPRSYPRNLCDSKCNFSLWARCNCALRF